MGRPTGKPNGRPRKRPKDLPGVPGSKEYGDAAREQLAASLLVELPLSERAILLVDLTKGAKQEDASYGAAIGARLTALRYINELSGVVTAAQEKESEAVAALPQILIASEAPPPKPGSAEALKLLATAKGSQYDEAFPSSPPPKPEPPGPMRGEMSVTVSGQQAS